MEGSTNGHHHHHPPPTTTIHRPITTITATILIVVHLYIGLHGIATMSNMHKEILVNILMERPILLSRLVINLNHVQDTQKGGKRLRGSRNELDQIDW
ncbi:hypothetical protein R6Q59_018054 [Mikania micrantha]